MPLSSCKLAFAGKKRKKEEENKDQRDWQLMSTKELWELRQNGRKKNFASCLPSHSPYLLHVNTKPISKLTKHV